MNLVLENLRVTAGAFTLEANVSLSGRAIGLFGDSGAGKTTLVETLAGLRRPVAGTIRLDGLVLDDAARRIHIPPERRGIGFVPQDGALFPHLSVRHNVLYGKKTAPSAPGDAPGVQALSLESVAAAMDVSDLLDRAVAGLSGGERQRVALARALLTSPRLLLLDEPLSSVDAGHKSAILQNLRRIRDEFGVPLVHVSHSPEEMSTLCDRVLVLSHGRIEGLQEKEPG